TGSYTVPSLVAAIVVGVSALIVVSLNPPPLADRPAGAAEEPGAELEAALHETSRITQESSPLGDGNTL
ncbi:MAG TPA: hypothetical protein VMB79_08830, partial [Jatrophihabitans sp.]|nr:hypothetical protein [Jatrophihabitans sp.]